MSGPQGPEPTGRRRLALFTAASAGVHLLLFLVPLAWWQALPWVGGGGDEAGGATGPEVLVVSLVDLPAFEAPAEPIAEPTEPRPEPEVEPEPVPDPELPVLPEPRVEPPPVPSTESGAGEGGDAGVESAGSGTAGSDAEGVPGPGEPEARYRPPRLLAGALPLTPEESQDLGADGPLEITVRLRVGRDGLVREVVPDDPALPPRLVEALNRSAAAMRFVPARLGDQAVEAWFSMAFVYRR